MYEVEKFDLFGNYENRNKTIYDEKLYVRMKEKKKLGKSYGN